MILGKITVKVEYINQKYFFCRPIANGLNVAHPQIVGIPHVVHMERNTLNTHLTKDEVFTTYAIFSRLHTDSQWLAGYTRVTINPITDSIYNSLLALYPQKIHTFRV